MSDLPYRVAVVTGAGKGVGRAVARALARAGVSVVANARTDSDLASLAEEISRAGGACVPVAGDVSSDATAPALAKAAREHFGACDLLINAAGIQPPANEVESVPVEVWRHAIEVNLTGTFLLCRAVLPEMKTMRRGRIINVASGLAFHPQPGLAAYGAAKAGVVQFSAILAAEAAPSGILVNSAHPGIVDTAIVQQNFADQRPGLARALIDRMATLTLITPEESARFFVWLVAAETESGAFVRIDDPAVQDKVAAFWREREPDA